MPDFVDRHSVVRTIWGDPDTILLIFAGSAAEFALNKAVDWLFFSGGLPRDAFGRLLSTVRYAQDIIFADEAAAKDILDRIAAIHKSVERKRGQIIPDWAYRDVLYMLIDYSERAYGLLHHPLTAPEQKDLYEVFRRAGERMRVPELPASYAEWGQDRRRHIGRDLAYSDYTSALFQLYRRQLGAWRYTVLLQAQANIVPDEVRRLLGLNSKEPLSFLIARYGMFNRVGLQSLVQRVLIPRRYRRQVRGFDRSSVE